MPRRTATGSEPRSVPVPGQVDRDQRPAQQERDPVPRVGVLGAAVEEDELGRAAPPDQDADAPARRHLERLAAHGGHAARGEAELAQVALADPDASAETLRSTCEEVLTLSGLQERLIDALLTLATGERGIERWEVFDLADVTGSVLAGRRREAEGCGIAVESALDAGADGGRPETGGEPGGQPGRQRPAPQPARRAARGGDGARAGRASISVRNTGPVVAADEVERLLQPFQRGQDRATRRHAGHGLGLAIVQAIAGAHGAALTARARPEGKLEVGVRF